MSIVFVTDAALATRFATATLPTKAEHLGPASHDSDARKVLRTTGSLSGALALAAGRMSVHEGYTL